MAYSLSSVGLTEMAVEMRRMAAIAVTTLTVVGLTGCQGGRAPIAYRPITLNGQCAETEPDGFRERATLQVQDNQVRALHWQLWVGPQGTCQFQGEDFQQVRWRPQIELTARDNSGCKLMIWRDDRRITLAHANCEARCTPGIYENAWPVMFDPQTGGCAVIQ